MAVEKFMSPTTSIQEFMSFGSVVEIAAQIAVFIALVWFVVFLRGLWVPKVPPMPRRANWQRLQQPSGAHKKTANPSNRAKKNKKARGAAHNKLEVISEEELEDVNVQSSSDLETPFLPSPRMIVEKEAPGASLLLSNAPWAFRKHVAEYIETCPEESACIGEPDFSETSTTSDRESPEDHIYTSSLLLMHREIAVRIARGAPGLDLPAEPALPQQLHCATICSSC